MQLPDNVIKICQDLYDSGFQSWIVGGSIRDSLLGLEPHDWDVATNALPEQVINLFPKVISTGIKHGTVTVILDGGSYEITTFRGDGKYSDGRHPDSVKFVSTIEEDLSRRDFTINAIAFNYIDNIYSDPFGGQEDLFLKIIKAVGNPHARFAEDGLRLLRGIRFAGSLDSSFELKTFDAICDSVDRLDKISTERITAELYKIMGMSFPPSKSFNWMYQTGILKKIIPELYPLIGCSQNKYHAFDVWEHTMRVLDNVPNDPILRFAALFHDIGKPAVKGIHPITGDGTFYEHEIIGAQLTDTILNRLKFSNIDREKIVHLVRHHYIRYDKSWSSAAIRRWVRNVGMDNISNLCAIARADINGKGTSELDVGIISEFENRIAKMSINEIMPTSTKVLAIDGNDVMKHLKIGPGPLVGKILKSLLEIITDDPDLNTKEFLLKELENYEKS